MFSVGLSSIKKKYGQTVIRLIYFCQICYIPFCGLSQSLESKPSINYKLRAQFNLNYLCKDSSILQHIRFDSAGIRYFSHPLNWRPDFTIYWDEIPYFIGFIDTAKVESYQRFLDKRNLNLYKGQVYTPGKYNGSEKSKMKIALDPGQVANSLEEALTFERRYVKIPASKLGLSGSDLELYESEMNYQISRMVKDLLEREGFEVIITKGKNNVSLLGKSFSEWVRKDYKNDLALAEKKGIISHDASQYLSSFGKPNELFSLYRILDFRKRSEVINQHKPDLTISINLNASERSSSHYGDFSISPVSEDYNMAFVPGAFSMEELQKPEAKMNFVRLLLSDDFSTSLAVAGAILQAEEKLLNVPVLKSLSELEIADFTIPAIVPGAYHRNLYILRAVRGPVVSLETLYQDNFNESQLLGAKTYTYHFLDNTKLETSFRLYEVANGIAKGVVAYQHDAKNK